MVKTNDRPSALDECEVAPARAAEICTRFARARRGDALAWWPSSPWRDATLAPGFLWLALVDDGLGESSHESTARPAASRLLGELASVLDSARTGRARTLLGRALVHSFTSKGFEADELGSALNAAHAFERGGTFATRRALADRAIASSGGSGPAWARLVERSGARDMPWRDFTYAPAGVAPRDTPREGMAVRLEAGFAAERLTQWIARPGPELAAGRLVLPLDELARAGLSPADLVERPRDERWAALVAAHVGWIRGFLARAWPAVGLAGPLSGRAIAMWLGGIERCLEKLEARAFDSVARPLAPPRAAPWRAILRSGPAAYRDLG